MRAAALLALALIGGCAAAPVLSPAATLPAAARSDPSRYLVVTVRNPVAGPARAASTSRGYDAAGPYIAGGTAHRVSRALAADYGLEEVSRWPIALLDVHCLVYGVPPTGDPGQLAAALKRDRRVESVQPLQGFATESTAYNDPYAKLQTNITAMAIAEAHALSRGAGVRIAMIDTGGDVAHPDLAPHGTRSRNFVDADRGAFAADPHGTAVAGIIGAIPNNGVGIVGVAPDAELLVYKACWRAAASGTAAVCNTFTLAQALAAAIEAHADIINLSLAGPSDPLLARLLRRGLERGIIVVGAVPRAGGRGSFPLDVDGVVAVDALESGSPASGTVLAPGRDVMSLAPGGHYDFYSGSSLATAEVSGLIALLRSLRPHLAANDAARLLIESAPAGAAPNACAALVALVHGGSCSRSVAEAAPVARSSGGPARSAANGDRGP